MKIQYRVAISVWEQLLAIDELLLYAARNRGLEDELVIKLYKLAEDGASYDQLYHTYLVGC